MTIRSLVGASTGIDQSRFSILSANPGVLNGDFESIATVTVGSGGASSIQFTSIPGTYQHLQIRMVTRSTRASAASGLIVRVNGDTGSNYASHLLYGTGASASAGAGTSMTSAYGGYTSAASATASIFGVAVTDILDYASTSKYKTLRDFSGADLNGSGEIRLTSGVWMSTSAITSITLLDGNSANFAQYSTASLYGLRAP